MSDQDSGGTAMPEDPRSDPERAVDALEEKVANQRSERSGTEQSDRERSAESEQEQGAADQPGIDPGSNHASTMHRAGESPA